jgi:hypothetical protein
MNRVLLLGIGLVVLGLAQTASAQTAKMNERGKGEIGYRDTPQIPGQKWKVHDLDRPHPPVVQPPTVPGGPPSDAIILFDGKDLSQWVHTDKQNSAPKWKVENGYAEIVGKSGSLMTKEKFGDCQLHIEFASPAVLDGYSQWRGNSGVIMMNRYEIQVLDSYESPTYADGQAGAIYGQNPPMVNVSRKPGEWQTYDIIFEAPKFDGDKVVKPAFATVIHNGVVVQHRREILGPMAHRVHLPYKPHSAEEPLQLQDHDTKVRYRNIWVRKLKFD